MRVSPARLGTLAVVITALFAFAAPSVGTNAVADAATYSACSFVTSADVHAAFGGQVGPGKNQTYQDEATCLFNLAGANTVGAALHAPVSGLVLVTARPLTATQFAKSLVAFKNGATGASPSCSWTDKKPCPLSGIGAPAYFLSVYVGGGGSGLLVMLADQPEFLLNTALNLVNDPAKEADNSGPGYEANQASLIILAKSVAAKVGAAQGGPTRRAHWPPSDLWVQRSRAELVTATVTADPRGVGDGTGRLNWSRPVTGCTKANCSLRGYTLNYRAFVTTEVHGQVVGGYKQLSKQLAGTAVSDIIPMQLDLSSDLFSLVAKSGYGAGASADLTVLLEVAPRAPSVTALPGVGAVTLSWVDDPKYDQTSGVGPLTGEAVYEGTSPQREGFAPVPASQMAVATVAATHGTATTVSVTVNGLTAGTTYYLKATALDAAVASARSNEVSVTTLGTPGPPVGVSTARANRQLMVSWQPPASEGGTPVTGYDVYKGTSPGAEGANPVATTTGTSVIVTNDSTNIVNGTAHLVRSCGSQRPNWVRPIPGHWPGGRVGHPRPIAAQPGPLHSKGPDAGHYLLLRSGSGKYLRSGAGVQ